MDPLHFIAQGENRHFTPVELQQLQFFIGTVLESLKLSSDDLKRDRSSGVDFCIHVYCMQKSVPSLGGSLSNLFSLVEILREWVGISRYSVVVTHMEEMTAGLFQACFRSTAQNTFTPRQRCLAYIWYVTLGLSGKVLTPPASCASATPITLSEVTQADTVAALAIYIKLDPRLPEVFPSVGVLSLFPSVGKTATEKTMVVAGPCESLDVCAVCSKGGELLLCGRCEAIHYCSTECQRKDWKKSHKGSCRKSD